MSTSYADRPWLSAYEPGVPADLDVPEVALPHLLDEAAASFPNGTAISFLGTRSTYRQLVQQVDRVAGGLAGLGVQRGDRVVVMLPNCPQNVVSVFATLRLGAVVVQANPLSTEAELHGLLADSGAVVVVCLDRTYPTVAAARADTAVREVVVTSLADPLSAGQRSLLRLPLPRARARRSRLVAGLPAGAQATAYRSLLRSAPRAQADLAPDDLALLQYTGGTTGVSRAAMLTHRNLVANAHQCRLWLPEATAGREVTLAVLPLFHVYGLMMCMLSSVLLAGELVLLPRFDLDLVFRAIAEHRPTLFPGVPPIYKAIVDSPTVRRYDLSSIRACLSGAMKLPTDTQAEFERITGGRLVEGYGLTETSPATHCNPVHGRRKAGSIGVPLPGTRAKVVRPDDSAVEVPVGEPGELAIAGPQVFAGYWQRDQQGVFTDDGYLLTGDLAVMDDDGFFRIVDRKKDVIIAGGFNIYPNEVEETLFALPGVADCCVVGLPDRYRGETVKAYVVPEAGVELTVEQVREHCARTLTAYKVPKLVEFRADLPRSAVGKALRRALIAEEQERAGG